MCTIIKPINHLSVTVFPLVLDLVTTQCIQYFLLLICCRLSGLQTQFVVPKLFVPQSKQINSFNFWLFVYDGTKDWCFFFLLVTVFKCLYNTQCVCEPVHACVSGRLLMVEAGLVVSFRFVSADEWPAWRARSLSLSQWTVWAPRRLAAVPMATRLHQEFHVPSMADILISWLWFVWH